MKKNAILGQAAQQYGRLQNSLRDLPLLAQGNVYAIDPPPTAPRASTHYKWTRKLDGKTVTEALSKQQYEAIKDAIEANRQIGETLRRMRTLSQDAILQALPDAPGKRRRKSP